MEKQRTRTGRTSKDNNGRQIKHKQYIFGVLFGKNLKANIKMYGIHQSSYIIFLIYNNNFENKKEKKNDKI